MMTVEELENHARECYKQAQFFSFFGNHAKADIFIGWAKRAEYRADCMSLNKGDPANGKL